MSRSVRLWLVTAVVGTLLVAAAAGGLALVRADPGRDDAGSDGADQAGRRGQDLPPGRRLAFVGDSLLVALPARAYLSGSRFRGDGFEAPERYDGAVLRVPVVDRQSTSSSFVQVLGTDQAGRVTEVMQVERTRDSEGRLSKVAWLVDNDGIELAWRSRPGWTWTVSRHDTVLTTTARDHFRDDRPVTRLSTAGYHVDHEEPVRIDDDTTVPKSTEYVVFPPVPDRALLGRLVSTIAPGGSVAARVAPDRAAACKTVSQAGGAVRESVASQDRVDLTNQLSDQVPGVRLVGLSMCGDRFVVVIGVKDDTVKVPERGPRGTPVMAYVQGRLVAD